MKKVITYLLFFLLVVKFSFAQKERNIWCFGTNCGLDFNSGAPVPFNGVVMAQQEGCSSISDANGSLLFYSDGVVVRDRNHVIMPNGSGLNGGPSSAQSALIIKQPGNTNIYYVFTPAQALLPGGFCYSIVDMSLNSGLGDVTTKNIQLFTPCAERVCATMHSNEKDVWIAAHEMGTNGFRSYLLTSAGLNPVPVISNFGAIHPATSSSVIGYMKFSHDGKRMACAIRTPNLTELFDFDNYTGAITNMVVSIPTASSGSYGVEFSPDNTKLYTTETGLNQFDISSGIATNIISSKFTITTSAWALQLGPDMKIYCAVNTSSKIDVINDPNLPGASCNFVGSAISLGTGKCRLGLPGSQFDIPVPAQPPVAHFTSSDTVFCDESGKCINFTDQSANTPTSWQWFFPGATPDTSSDQNPSSICYYTPGTYSVKLISTNANGTDTLDVSPMIIFSSGAALPTLTFSGDTIFCSHAATYQWFMNGSAISGATDSFYIALIPANYSVQITDENGCSRLSNGVISNTYDQSLEDLTIYPNPVKESFVVDRHSLDADKIEIYNVVGEKVYSDSLKSKSDKISCEPFPDGIYLLKISDDKIVRNCKIIIRK